MFLRNGLEPWHLLVVALVVVLVFGSKRLPDTARSLGKSLRILKSETKALKRESQERGEGAADGPAGAAGTGGTHTADSAHTTRTVNTTNPARTE